MCPPMVVAIHLTSQYTLLVNVKAELLCLNLEYEGIDEFLGESHLGV